MALKVSTLKLLIYIAQINNTGSGQLKAQECVLPMSLMYWILSFIKLTKCNSAENLSHYTYSIRR